MIIVTFYRSIITLMQVNAGAQSLSKQFFVTAISFQFTEKLN